MTTMEIAEANYNIDYGAPHHHGWPRKWCGIDSVLFVQLYGFVSTIVKPSCTVAQQEKKSAAQNPANQCSYLSFSILIFNLTL